MSLNIKKVWRRIKWCFKRLNKKHVRIFLFAASGALAIAAAALFFVLWTEGETAAKNAETLLEASGIEPAVSTSSEGSQTDAENTQDSSKTGGAFETELEGYCVIARLDINTLDVHLPVLAEISKEALKVSACYYSGPAPGADGNLVITGHNYANGAHFGTLDQIAVGDAVCLTDTGGTTATYTVYALEHVNPDDTEALDDTEYARELTLLTCEYRGNRRLLVRCVFNG